MKRRVARRGAFFISEGPLRPAGLPSRPFSDGVAMFRDFSGQSFFMGVLTAFVGFVSSFAVVLQGA